MRHLAAVAVFCGSNTGLGSGFIDAAEKLGSTLAAKNIRLVYGGANNGLMGALARAVRQGGGDVYGVITEKLLKKGHLFDDLNGHTVVETTALRKMQMTKLADAFIALPGGIGTTEEFMAVWSENQLGYIDKPVGLLNVDKFFDPFISYIDKMVSCKFLPLSHRHSIVVEADPETLLQGLAKMEKTSEAKWL